MQNNRALLSQYPYFISLIFIVAFLGAMLWLISELLADALYPLASAVAAISVFIALIYLRPKFSPAKWLAMGIVVTIIFTLYPLLFTVYLSITNMGSGHLMSAPQAIDQLESQLYLPEGGVKFGWAAYQAPDESFLLWLIAEDGTALRAVQGEEIREASPNDEGVSELGSDGFPVSIEGYTRLETRDVVANLTALSEIDFGVEPDTVRVQSIREAGTLRSRYRYDAKQDIIVDQRDETVYRPIEGTFTSDAGETIAPGYIVFAGTRHYENFLGNESFREPLIRMLIWNINFATLSMLISFALGLVVTLLFDDLPGRSVIRALLIIPWPIPVLVSILIWRSMLNPDLGFVAPALESLFGSSPAWFQNHWWTRFAVILVNVWLSYPYFYVISAGAIRSIPSEIYDAAIVDGAGWWSKFNRITLPLILRILMPLLIASFTFNFNNFNVIYIFNFGDPPMANTIIPMGQTDILISFVYRLAFVTSNVTNYGLAAAITVLLFVLVSFMVMIQLRVTKPFADME